MSDGDWKTRALRAEARERHLVHALQLHHDWHQKIGTVKLGDDDVGWHEVDLSEAYADSNMCDFTIAALKNERLPSSVSQRLEHSGETARLRSVIQEARDILHAHNRPKLSDRVRLRVRDLLDQGLKPVPESARVKAAEGQSDG